MAYLTVPVGIIYVSVCSIVDVIVLFLNPIIISVIRNDRQLRRQPSIIYIANLALVDLCLAAVNLSQILFYFVRVAKTYPLCLIFHGYLTLTLMTASLCFMFTNSVDRFIFIRMSMKYHSIMNSRIARRVALFIWIFSISFPILPFIIIDHVWEYDSCNDFIGSATYRFAHVPTQTIFFITIIFTVLMFISVFRVVKNSRKLRHVTTRSVSMDSLSTPVSSPMLSTPVPGLPPIFELVPYEHENVENSGKFEANTPHTSVCKKDTSIDGKKICLSEVREQESNLQVSPEDIAQSLNKPQMLFKQGLQENTDHAQSEMRSEDTGINERELQKQLLEINRQTNKNTWTHPVSDNFNKTQNESYNCEHNADNRTNFENNEETKHLKHKSSVIFCPSDERYHYKAVELEESSLQSYTESDKISQYKTDSLEKVNHVHINPATANNVNHHSKILNKKFQETIPFPFNEITKFNDGNIKIANSYKPWGAGLDELANIPTEPLKMLNFKMQMWSMQNSVHSQEIYVSRSRTFIGDLASKRRHRKKKHKHRLKSKHIHILHFAGLHLLKKRRRHASETSSTLSLESVSSFSQGTTESTITNDSSSSLPKITDASIDTNQPEHTSVKLQSEPLNIYIDSNISDTQLILPLHIAKTNQRTMSARHELLECVDRNRRPNRLSLRHHNQLITSDSPKLHSRSPKRTYSRNISTTTTTSSSSSAPFGTTSYSGRDIRTLKILFLMFCVYIMLWLPSFIIQVLRYFAFDINMDISIIGYTFGISNSVFNFFVYPMRIPKLRVSFKQLFRTAVKDLKKNMNWLVSLTKRSC